MCSISGELAGDQLARASVEFPNTHRISSASLTKSPFVPLGKSHRISSEVVVGLSLVVQGVDPFRQVGRNILWRLGKQGKCRPGGRAEIPNRRLFGVLHVTS
ncbi:uncharacterized protein LACBIDRAFT_314577 [Laccaria bicolor S238N-H82]|uniref:Predicted protein n=1 Tax=Laccaria bicolor (strain S238N-H82 / ATCC MYA-4686) TaxID=486041 RepID=B0DYU4_LACBS|nr:uncharacterized protein LACBIDRAFT_314577 [Laccaria bicolor S238N-H82]EDR00198.1 predicted protein [Laccaria bicolor S238N-H82]|eukprot:XP_001889107.1 predicted protein [Laccaria bicolor S238N-H82]